MASSKSKTDNGDRALPLSELKQWFSEEVFDWIKKGDEKREQLEKELEENAFMNAANLFGDDESDDEKIGGKKKGRIQKWFSSATSPDGVGGFVPRQSSLSPNEDSSDAAADDQSGVDIVFLLSDSYEGFGDILWSSARYVANNLSNPSQCEELLSPLMDSLPEDEKTSFHPLVGKSLVEVGAGAGVPSWAAMKCGANVVCTDLSDSNRIRSMAECVERNFRQVQEGDPSDEKTAVLLANAAKTRVCPHDWGSPVDKVVEALNSSNNEADEERKFDIVVAADCCYMPWWHKELLDSIYNLLSDRGVAIVAFALHSNTDDDDVWKIVDRAKYRGFVVEILESQQLTPPSAAMEAKQGLVHIVRLTKPKE